jgi:hypothetical protein
MFQDSFIAVSAETANLFWTEFNGQVAVLRGQFFEQLQLAQQQTTPLPPDVVLAARTLLNNLQKCEKFFQLDFVE